MSQQLHAVALEPYDPMLLAGCTLPQLSEPLCAAFVMKPPHNGHANEQALFELAPAVPAAYVPIKGLASSGNVPSMLRALEQAGFDWGPASALVLGKSASGGGEVMESEQSFYANLSDFLNDHKNDLSAAGDAAAGTRPDMHLMHHHVRKYMQGVSLLDVEQAFEGIQVCRLLACLLAFASNVDALSSVRCLWK